MAKKTKPRLKKIAKRATIAKRTPTKHVKSISLSQRKHQITDAIEALMAATPLEDRHEIAEHLCDIGIDVLGFVTGVDSSNAIVTFPDDGVSRLIDTIVKHEALTQVPCDAIIDRLIKSLNDETFIPSSGLLN